MAQDGTGDSKTVQAALDTVPKDNKSPFVIYIKPGTYHEKLTVDENKPFVQFVGSATEEPVLTFDDYANKPGPNGKPMGTFATASVYIKGHDFLARNITFQNTAFPRQIVGQAVAVRNESDRSSFENCRFLGNQDTLFANAGRQYYHNCLIHGDVDFIFGNAAAVFDQCDIESVGKGYVSAQSRTDPAQPTGYVFRDCTLGGTAPNASVFLGRPWRPYARVIYIECTLGPQIDPTGWNNWRDPAREKTAYFAEVGSKGPGANTSSRVSWARTLTLEEEATYSTKAFLAGSDGWNPESDLEKESQ